MTETTKAPTTPQEWCRRLNATLDIREATRQALAMDWYKWRADCPLCGAPRRTLHVTFRRRLKCSACRQALKLVMFVAAAKGVHWVTAVDLLKPIADAAAKAATDTAAASPAGHSNPLLAAALAYARRGWPVVPLHHPTEGGGCSCLEREKCAHVGKHPTTANGVHNATTDETVIRQWWCGQSAANVGVVPSSRSGIWILDVDPKHGGDETLAELECKHGELPPTVEVLTGSGGRHLYFARTGDPRESNLRNRACAPGLDMLTNGGLAVAPPSRHGSGRAYEWEAAHHPDDTEILPAPDWLLDLCARQAAQPADGVTPYGRAALSGEVERVRLAAESTRNDTLNSATFKIGQLVEPGHIQQAVAASELAQAGRTAGLPAREVRDTVRSGLKGGKRKPRANVPPVVRPGGAGQPPPADRPPAYVLVAAAQVAPILELIAIREPGTRVPAAAVYSRYSDRCASLGRTPASARTFGLALSALGVQDVKGTAGRRDRIGLRLREEVPA